MVRLKRVYYKQRADKRLRIIVGARCHEGEGQD